MLERFFRKKINHLFVIPLVILSLIMPACMPKLPGSDQMRPEYYPQCYQPIKYLEESQDALIKRTFWGALGGTALGTLIGGLTKGSKGALAGAIVGLLAGGVISYGAAKMFMITDDKERLRSYQIDMDVDMLNASRVEQYAMASMRCYNREFKQLLVDYKQGLRTKEEVEARYQEIRRGLIYISGILENARKELEDNSKEYREAIEKEVQKQGAIVPTVITSGTTGKSKTVNRGARSINDEIDKREQDAGIRATQIMNQHKDFNKGNKELSVDTVANYFGGRYLDSLVSLEEAEDVNQKNLDVMELAAQSLGLDAA